MQTVSVQVMFREPAQWLSGTVSGKSLIPALMLRRSDHHTLPFAFVRIHQLAAFSALGPSRLGRYLLGLVFRGAIGISGRNADSLDA